MNLPTTPTPAPLSLIQLILNVAISQIGICEIPKGSNAGPDVEKYLKSVGLSKGNSWCMAFVYWCVGEACKQASQTISIIKTGHVLHQWNNVNKALKFTTKPQPGDIFIMDFGGGSGHTGFVTKVENGRIYTIEGNSNTDGSREGNMVCRKPTGRAIGSIKGYIRLV